MKSTINHSDAVIVASEGVSSSLTKFIESSGKLFTFVPKMLSLRRIVFYNEML
jgi:starch synthase